MALELEDVDFDNTESVWDAYKRRRSERAEEAQEAEEESPETEDTEEVSEDEEDVEEVELDEESEEGHPQPALEPPAGFDDVWEELPDTAQERIAKKIKEADSLITRKSEELANTQKESEATRQRFEQELEQMHAILEAAKGQLPDPPPAKLLREDPDAYYEQRASYDEAVEQQKAVDAELEKIKENQQNQLQERIKKIQTDRVDYLKSTMPEFIEDTDRQNAAVEYARKKLPNPEVLQYASGPELEILEKARLYDELTASGKRVKKAAPKSVKSGSPVSAKAKRKKAFDEEKRKVMASGNEREILAFMKKARRLKEKG